MLDLEEQHAWRERIPLLLKNYIEAIAFLQMHKEWPTNFAALIFASPCLKLGLQLLEFQTSKELAEQIFPNLRFLCLSDYLAGTVFGMGQN